MYVVDNSARKATITLTGEEVAVKFPCTYSVFGIKGDNMLLYPKSGMAQGADGVYDTAEGDGSAMMPLYYQTDTVYIKGTGSCVVWAGNSPLDCPFPKSGKGGDDGGTLRMLGATTTPLSDGATTNPITIDGQSVTAEKNDVAIYNTREFYFSGTTWSEFGGQMDTVPTQGSANAVTSDGIYQRTPFTRGTGSNSAVSGLGSRAVNENSISAGVFTVAQNNIKAAFGAYNNPKQDDLFEVGNGAGINNRSNILEVTYTGVNVNGDIQQNSVPLRATTMPTITASMLGKVVQYVGASDSNYKQGWNYVAVSDGEETPTYRWQALMDSTPTSDSNNPVTSDGIYKLVRKDSGNGTVAIGGGTGLWTHYQPNMVVCGQYNTAKNNDLFEIGAGTNSANRKNIVEVNSTEMNVNGDIQRYGVGIDDYTTTERKIGKWIDGSDLYQRTFEISDLAKNTWHTSLLGTTGIDIVDLQGFVEWYKISDDTLSARQTLNYFDNTNERNEIFVDSTGSDLFAYFAYSGSAQKSNCKAVITIKYTKPSVQANALNANIQQTQTEEPTDEMR